MVDEANKVEEHRSKPALKVVEPSIDPNNIWDDDKLERERIAERLTAIVEDQEAPFVVSLDGRWGTGKTFLLKRWQAQLERAGFQAIYFNAWEDDFCDDPLLAIIGQLSGHFDDGKFKDVALKIANFGVGLLTKQLTGSAIDLTEFKPESVLNDYHDQRRTKEKMKTELRALAKDVKQDSGKPLVFIIDELDRCRPTFAIELLERVKHIFDVPNIVFVFGINRGELQKSLKSIYGDIEAGVYLRRFFDMEFVLPRVDPEVFCRYLLQRYELWPHFRDSGPATHFANHADEYGSIAEQLHQFFRQLDLSLRDMDYCLRVLTLAARGLAPGRSLFPYALVALIATKVVNIDLYRRFMSGNASGAEIIDYIYKQPPPVGTERMKGLWNDDSTRVWIEAAMYCIDDNRTISGILSSDGHFEDLPNSELLSQRARNRNHREFATSVLERMRAFSSNNFHLLLNRTYMAELIDLHSQPDAH